MYLPMYLSVFSVIHFMFRLTFASDLHGLHKALRWAIVGAIVLIS